MLFNFRKLQIHFFLYLIVNFTFFVGIVSSMEEIPNTITMNPLINTHCLLYSDETTCSRALVLVQMSLFFNTTVAKMQSLPQDVLGVDIDVISRESTNPILRSLYHAQPAQRIAIFPRIDIRNNDDDDNTNTKTMTVSDTLCSFFHTMIPEIPIRCNFSDGYPHDINLQQLTPFLPSLLQRDGTLGNFQYKQINQNQNEFSKTNANDTILTYTSTLAQLSGWIWGAGRLKNIHLTSKSSWVALETPLRIPCEHIDTRGVVDEIFDLRFPSILSSILGNEYCFHPGPLFKIIHETIRENIQYRKIGHGRHVFGGVHVSVLQEKDGFECVFTETGLIEGRYPVEEFIRIADETQRKNNDDGLFRENVYTVIIRKNEDDVSDVSSSLWTVKLPRVIEGTGLHRTLTYTPDIYTHIRPSTINVVAKELAHGCKLALVFRLEASTYFDLDEIRRDMRKNMYSILSFEPYFDIEEITEKSTQHSFILFIPIVSSDKKRDISLNKNIAFFSLSTPTLDDKKMILSIQANISLKLHMRYQAAGCGSSSPSSILVPSPWTRIMSRVWSLPMFADGSMRMNGSDFSKPPTGRPFISGCYAFAHLPQPSVHLMCEVNETKESILSSLIKNANGHWIPLPISLKSGTTSLPLSREYVAKFAMPLAPIPVGEIDNATFVLNTTIVILWLCAGLVMFVLCIKYHTIKKDVGNSTSKKED